MGDNKITYLDYMKLYPSNSGTSLRSKKDILNHLLIEYAIASIATYAFYSSHALIKDFLRYLDEKFNMSKLFNSKEKELILNINNNLVDKDELSMIMYRFERCNMFMWALGFIEEISYEKKCNVKTINRIIFECKDYYDLLNKSNIIDNNILINYFSDISKISHIQNSTNVIVSEQEEALNYILFYNPNRDSLKVLYENNDLRFEILLPSSIIFEKVNNKSNELFAFKSKYSNIKMVMQDLKNINIQDNVKSFEDKGYVLVDVNSISSIYLDRKIVKTKFEKDSIAIYIYYMIINKHLIRLGSLENNTNVDMDVILSIKMF